MADKLTIFVSSPGDVGQERLISTRIIERLNGEFSRYFKIEPYLWEHEPLLASDTFQPQIVRPSDTDIVIFILWSRLGTRLPEHIKRPDGSFYASGTEFEFENALEAFKEKGLPDLLVYRKIQEPNFIVSDEEVLLEKLEQKKALDTFVDKWFGSSETGFKAAFHAFKSADEYEDLLETHLKKLIREKIPEVPVSTPVKRYYQDPFRGLESFEFEHAPVFFGRTKAIGEIIQRFTSARNDRSPFVTVYGMSGCGKSSLVKAGVLPFLTQPGIIEGVDLWRHGVLRPGDASEDLLTGLVNTLKETGVLPELQQIEVLDGSLIQHLKGDPQKAEGMLQRAFGLASQIEKEERRYLEEPRLKLILVLDQLEELFTLERISNQDRLTFSNALSQLVATNKIWVIATMRSDFYHRLGELPDLARLSEGGEYRLLNPQFTEVGQMIRNPAFAAGLAFEVNLETGERLDDVIHQAASQDTASLPLLEFTLTELFKKRAIYKNSEEILTIKAYEEMGGLEGALAKKAEAVYSSLDNDARNAFPNVFRALVTSGQQGDTVITNQQVPYDSISHDLYSKQLVDVFIKERLLVSDRDSTGRTIVRIAHEALLHCWPRLKDLLEEARDFLRIRKRVTDAANQWLKEDKRKEFLLAKGKPLMESEELLKQYRNEITPETIEFIQTSRKKAKKAKLTKWMLVAASFVVVIGFLVITFLQLQEVSRQKEAVVAQTNITMEKQVQLLSDASMEATDSGDLYKGLPLALEAYTALLDSKNTSRESTERVVSALYKTLYPIKFQSIARLEGHVGAIDIAEFSPDGSTLLTASTYPNKEVKVWDAKTFTELYSVDTSFNEFLSTTVYSQDGSMFLLFGESPLEVVIYKAKTGEIIQDIKLPIEYSSTNKVFVFLPGDKQLFVQVDDLKVIYDIQSGKLVKALEVKGRPGPGEFQTVVSPDYEVFASTLGSGKGAWIGDIKTGEMIADLSDNFAYECLTFSPDGRFLAVGSLGQIKIINTSDWSQYQLIQTNASNDSLYALSFDATGDKILIGYRNAGAGVYDSATGNLLFSLPTSGEAFYSGSFSPDGKTIFTNTEQLKIWDGENGKQLATIDTMGEVPIGSTYSKDSKQLIVTLNDSTARIYTLTESDSLERIETFSGSITHQNPMMYDGSWEVYINHTVDETAYGNFITQYATSKDGRYFAIAHPDNFLEVYDRKNLEDKQASMTFNNHSGPINSIFFSFDSRYLITASYDHKAIVYDLEHKKILHILNHTNSLHRAEFSKDNRLIFTWCGDGTAHVWSAHTGQELFTMSSGGKIIQDVGFDEANENIIMVMDDGSGLKARVYPDDEELVKVCQDKIN